MSGNDAAARLTQDTAELIRQQLDELRGELSATARRMGAGSVLLVAAGAMGPFAATAAHQTALRLLEAVVPRPVAAGILTLGYAAGGGALVVVGLDRIRAAAESADRAVIEASRPQPSLDSSDVQ